MTWRPHSRSPSRLPIELERGDESARRRPVEAFSRWRPALPSSTLERRRIGGILSGIDLLAARPRPPLSEGRDGIGEATTAASLAATVAALAHEEPGRPVLIDGTPGTGDPTPPGRVWDAARTAAAMQALSDRLARLGLPPRAPVGLLLAGGAQASISCLAIQHAGLTPCPLPLAAGERTLAGLVERTGMEAVVTQTELGELRPCETITRVAAGFFRLRFPLSFGPDVPDGVVSLDADLETAAPARPPGSPVFGTKAGAPEAGALLFITRPPAREAVVCAGSDLMASAAEIVAAAEIRPGERIVTLLAPESLAALTSGLAAALLAGACLDGLGMFESARLVRALDGTSPLHLVVPGRAEHLLAGARLPDHVRSVLVVHEPPVSFRKTRSIGRTVVDILSIDQTALIVARRGAEGRPTLTIPLDDHERRQVRVDESGVWVRGAGDADESARGLLKADWRLTRWRPETLSNLLVGLTSRSL